MRMSTRKPIIWPIVRLAFPAAEWGTVIVTFARTTYCAEHLPPELVAHEQVHQDQQKNVALALVWWARYILSARFRFDQELPAHRAEYKTARATRNINRMEMVLDHAAKRLSGPLYNNLTDYAHARLLINNPQL